MCEREQIEVRRDRDGAAAGVQCAPLTPEVRTHLQTCLVSVELLTALELPGEACRCAQRLERAVHLLVDGLIAGGPSKMVEAGRHLV